MTDSIDRALRVLKQRSRPPSGPPPTRPVEFAPPPCPPSMSPECGVASVKARLGGYYYTITQQYGVGGMTGAGPDAGDTDGLAAQPAREILNGSDQLEVGELVYFFWNREGSSRGKTNWNLCCIGLHRDANAAAGIAIEVRLGSPGCGSIVFDKRGRFLGACDHNGLWHPRIVGAAKPLSFFVDGV